MNEKLARDPEHKKAEAPRPRRRSRLLDWRFLVALTALLIVIFLILGGVQAVKQRDHLLTIIGDKDRDSATARTEASKQRDTLLRQQARLLRRLGQLERRASRLDAYLREQGIELPSTLASDTPSGSRSRRSTESSPTVPKSGSGGGVETKPGSDSTPSPAPPVPTPPAPPPPRGGPVRDLLEQLEELIP